MAAIDRARLGGLLAPGDEEGASTAAKGDALEAAIRYAFEQIPGVTCEMQRVKNATGSEEIDLFFANAGHGDGLRRFESELLVEAKNWAKRVGAIELAWFATKLRRRGQRTGVLVAASGITGEESEVRAAASQVNQALQEGQEVLVLTREELEALPNGERLARLLHEKRDHLIARQDILIADPASLKAGTRIHLGSEAFGALLRRERVKLVIEAQELGLAASGEGESFDQLRSALERAIEAQANWDEKRDPLGRELRERVLEAAGWCTVWLARLEFDDPKTLWFNASQTGLDRVGPTVGSEFWQVLVDYYLSQLESDRPRELVLFALLAMLIEQVLSIDDYVPEEWG